jgi:hypothetical protein
MGVAGCGSRRSRAAATKTSFQDTTSRARDQPTAVAPTHFLMKRLPKVATEMALQVLAYNLTRVMNIIGGPTAAGSDASMPWLWFQMGSGIRLRG